MDLRMIQQKIRAFRDERDWTQFHNPKNLAISISIEAAELLEYFQWKNYEESEKHAIEARDQIADEAGCASRISRGALRHRVQILPPLPRFLFFQ